ncbi:YMGG-like glycine zipper-containing protein [Chryseobacterium daeguense]|uniref:YMGG-like glycine zipper-containing protein n=1 Tax=Chryseobacterium daeguense TaxID=412438 RepID=UPI0004801683|nr:YMGG-like glycine zipper-containing protein [Chryseobacterium daeguense]
MKSIVLTGLLSVFLLTACKKDDQVAEKSLEQQKMEFQMRQLEIEKQKLAIEKEKIAYEAQKKADSIAEVQKAKTAAAANNPRPQVIRETHTVYRDRPSQSSNNGSYADNGSSASQGTTQKQGMSKAAKGTIIGTVGGAAAGAIIAKKNRGLGAVIGGVVGGATGYTIGRAGDRKDGRVQPR